MRLLDRLFIDVISFTKVTSRVITDSTWNYTENVVCTFSTREVDDMRIQKWMTCGYQRLSVQQLALMLLRRRTRVQSSACRLCSGIYVDSGSTPRAIRGLYH